MKKITIIVPCYNEERCINKFYTELLKNLKKLKMDYEILFVDDGSKDDTLNEIKKINNKKVKYISFSRNFGKEAAMYAGLKESTGDYVTIMDVDLQDPPELLIEMVSEINKGEYDSIATRRKDRKNEPRLRSFFANSFYAIFNKLTDIEIVSGARDFRLMKRNMVNAILEISEKERFTKGIFAWIGFKTKWITFDNIKRSCGNSKWNLKSLFKYSIMGLTSYTTTPLFFPYLFSLLFFLITIILLVLLFGNNNDIFLKISCLLCFISSINFFVLGIIAQYISKTYIETRNRPLYVVKEKNN